MSATTATILGVRAGIYAFLGAKSGGIGTTADTVHADLTFRTGTATSSTVITISSYIATPISTELQAFSTDTDAFRADFTKGTAGITATTIGGI